MATPLLARADDLPRIVEELARASRVAIDTEFHAERRYRPQLYLVQFHVEGGSTWIVDPLERDLLPRLADSLARVTWIVHGGAHDIRLLHDALGAVPARILDTQIAAALVDITFPAPYGALVERWLGRKLEKGATLSDWSRRPLSAAQLSYAAEDVLLLLPLWDAIAARVEALGRGGLAESACAEARDRALDVGAEPAWRELPGVATLDPQQAAVLLELAIWRDETARREDQPPRAIAPDGFLLEFARRQPLTVEGLASDRRVSRGILKRYGDEIVARIQRAAARPDWSWPRVVARDSAHSRVVAWLESFAHSEARANDWAARLVLPRPLLEELALHPPIDAADLEGRLGWRAALCTDRLLKAFRGEVSLRLDDGEVLSSP